MRVMVLWIAFLSFRYKLYLSNRVSYQQNTFEDSASWFNFIDALHLVNVL